MFNITAIVDDIVTNPSNFISACALIVSIIAIATGFVGLMIQRKHNILSVRPIGNIGLFQGPAIIEISIINNGTGPMIIKSVETENKEGIKKKYPVDWIPLQDRQLFWTALEDISIKSGSGIYLLKFKYNPSNPDQEQKRDNIRSILKDLSIRIKYTDIYDRVQPDLVKPFDYFGEQIWEQKEEHQEVPAVKENESSGMEYTVNYYSR